MIEFQQVCRSYGDKVAVENLNLRVSGGELYSLLGHNGAGKTTAIKMLVGLIRPGSGTIRVGGYDVVTQTREAVVADRLRARPAVSVRQAFRPRDPAIRRPHVRHGHRAGRRGRSTARSSGSSWREFVDELTETYSHGMKQRTVFASALLHAPRVLVVDEPMVGLDPHSIRLVKDLLQREVAAGMCVLMSTHTLTAAEEISNRVGIMNHGQLLFDGTLDELRERFPGRAINRWNRCTWR